MSINWKDSYTEFTKILLGMELFFSILRKPYIKWLVSNYTDKSVRLLEKIF